MAGFRFKNLTTKMSHPHLKKGKTLRMSGDEASMGLIYGKKPGSIEEWRVATALWNLGYDFDFQVSFFGGHQVGGFVVDFIVRTAIPVPIEVIGEYWHQNTPEEEFRRMALEDEIGATIVYIIETELESYEEAVLAVSKAMAV